MPLFTKLESKFPKYICTKNHMQIVQQLDSYTYLLHTLTLKNDKSKINIPG